MENKKIINILLKDMGELEELISEIKTGNKFNLQDIEFLHTRSKGILQLMQMLNNTEPDIKTHPEFKGKEPEAENSAAINTVCKKNTAEEINIPAEPGTTTAESLPGNNIEPEEIKTEANRRLCDSFTKGKSLNDTLEDCNKLEFKLSNRPVNNIQIAIGINDRFQYIRELFDGSSEKYNDTVASLDSMSSIVDALSYLQQNFQWQQNETSLKFVNLVKRRFANE